MNIFKVLSSGDGAIKEPNLSAFLAYLLNPKEDHGLGASFLEKVLEPFLAEKKKDTKLKTILDPLFSHDGTLEDDPYILDLSISSRFNIDIVLEKAIRNTTIYNFDAKNTGKGKTKEIVDIIIKITQHQKLKPEDLNYLFEQESPVALILLENKINKTNKAGEQLSAQYKNSLVDLPNYINKKYWPEWKDKICTILVSTAEKTTCDQFVDFKREINDNSIHISWKNNKDYTDGNSPTASIKNICQELLRESNEGIISPINHYASDTIKALINFIEYDFSSNADDQQRGGQKSKVIPYGSVEEIYEKKPEIFEPDMWTFVKDISKKLKADFTSLKNISHDYTKTHVMTIKYYNEKIADISANSKSKVDLTFKWKIFPKKSEILNKGYTKDFYKNLKSIFKDVEINSNGYYYITLSERNLDLIPIITKTYLDYFYLFKEVIKKRVDV